MNQTTQVKATESHPEGELHRLHSKNKQNTAMNSENSTHVSSTVGASNETAVLNASTASGPRSNRIYCNFFLQINHIASVLRDDRATESASSSAYWSACLTAQTHTNISFNTYKRITAATQSTSYVIVWAVTSRLFVPTTAAMQPS